MKEVPCTCGGVRFPFFNVSLGVKADFSFVNGTWFHTTNGPCAPVPKPAKETIRNPDTRWLLEHPGDQVIKFGLRNSRDSTWEISLRLMWMQTHPGQWLRWSSSGYSASAKVLQDGYETRLAPKNANSPNLNRGLWARWIGDAT